MSGKRISNYNFFDFETTGLYTDKDTEVEIYELKAIDEQAIIFYFLMMIFRPDTKRTSNRSIYI